MTNAHWAISNAYGGRHDWLVPESAQARVNEVTGMTVCSALCECGLLTTVEWLSGKEPADWPDELLRVHQSRVLASYMSLTLYCHLWPNGDALRHELSEALGLGLGL